MAAITPHLEEQGDPAYTEEERELDAGGGDFDGLGDVDQLRDEQDLERIFASGSLAGAVLDKSHAELMQMAWLRKTVGESLIGARYKVQAGNAAGKDKRNVYIVLDRGVVPAGEFTAAWNPAASPNARQYKVLSWTSKMGTPSFSLPAGALEIGGACPGAEAGQSIVPLTTLRVNAKQVSKVLGKPVRLDQSICERCYAEGGQYSTGGVQFAQVLRYIWVKDALANGSFVDTMLYAIEEANFRLEGTKKNEDIEEDGGPQVTIDGVVKKKKKLIYPPELDGKRYFRIHDSGDFFHRDYLEAWVEIAHGLPDITFWAPTRIWATKWGIEAVEELNDAPNLIIRPSAYHVNEAPPHLTGPGWAKGTTVYNLAQKPGEYDWDCQAYAVEDQSHTCRHAKSPETERTGKPGCRACWKFGDEYSVNYTEH